MTRADSERPDFGDDDLAAAEAAWDALPAGILAQQLGGEDG